MKHGQRGRRDETEIEIVDALRKAGAFVVRCHGDGAPDLICWWRNRWLPIEVKTRRGKVLEKQERFPIARTAEEALALFD